jgi:hypothetical protein
VYVYTYTRVVVCPSPVAAARVAGKRFLSFIGYKVEDVVAPRATPSC